MSTRSVAVTAAVAGAAALAATGITYASAAPTPDGESAAATQAAAPVTQAVPAAAPMGGEGGDGGSDPGHPWDEGTISFNERTYSADPGGCVTVVSGLGSTSFNVRNDTKRTVEVFNGATCDNGAPIATVGPHSSANSIAPGYVDGGVQVVNGVTGSFRVVKGHGHDGKY